MKVEIYGTRTCGYCLRAVSLCKEKSIDYNYIDVGNEAILQTLIDRMGVRPRTVPQIFVDGIYLPGGFDGLRQELAKS